MTENPTMWSLQVNGPKEQKISRVQMTFLMTRSGSPYPPRMLYGPCLSQALFFYFFLCAVFPSLHVLSKDWERKLAGVAYADLMVWCFEMKDLLYTGSISIPVKRSMLGLGDEPVFNRGILYIYGKLFTVVCLLPVQGPQPWHEWQWKMSLFPPWEALLPVESPWSHFQKSILSSPSPWSHWGHSFPKWT